MSRPTPTKKLHILSGCTAAGKTELALRWAERFGAEIISCDSLLFYRGMDIGTAKPSREELARVPHHLVDVCGLEQQMDITRYIMMAREAAEAILQRGAPVLVVGGSGFYLKSFFAAVSDEVAVPDELSERVRALPASEVLAQLKALNPGGLGALDLDNPRRTMRALERCLSTGKTYQQLLEDFARLPGPFADWETEFVCVERDPEELNQRVQLRVEQMLNVGLVAEVRGLLAQGLRVNPSASKAIGYREVIACLDGQLPESNLAAEIVKNTKALVKKQRTWFRTQVPAHKSVKPELAQVETLFVWKSPEAKCSG